MYNSTILRKNNDKILYDPIRQTKRVNYVFKKIKNVCDAIGQMKGINFTFLQLKYRGNF